MLSPCNNDLNFVLKAEGWDYERNDAARGFIGGLNGWYDKKAGFEKYPLCDTQALVPFAGVPPRVSHSGRLSQGHAVLVRSMASCWSKCATRPR